MTEYQSPYTVIMDMWRSVIKLWKQFQSVYISSFQTSLYYRFLLCADVVISLDTVTSRVSESVETVDLILEVLIGGFDRNVTVILSTEEDTAVDGIGPFHNIRESVLFDNVCFHRRRLFWTRESFNNHSLDNQNDSSSLNNQ